MAKQLKRVNEIEIEQWKMCFAAYTLKGGNANDSYEYLMRFDEFDKRITKKMFRELVDSGDPSRNLPSMQQLFIANLRRSMANSGSKVRDYMDKIVKVSEKYITALDAKVDEFIMDPTGMSKNVATELQKTFELFAKYDEITRDKSDRVDITLDEAIRIKADGSRALARLRNISPDSDYGLEAKVK